MRLSPRSGSVKGALVAALCLAGAIFPSPVRSEIYNCDGKWTNKPCDGEAAKVIPEREQNVDLQSESARKKRSLLDELRNRLTSASRSYNIWLDISGIEETCRSEETQYDECMSLVQNAEDRLESRVAEAKILKEQEKTNRLLEDSQAAKENGGQENNTAVSVTQDNSAIIIGDPLATRPGAPPAIDRRSGREDGRDDRRGPSHEPPKRPTKIAVGKGF